MVISGWSRQRRCDAGQPGPEASKRAWTRILQASGTAEQLLASPSPEIRELARRIRDLVLSTLGDLEARVNAGWGGLAHHDAQAGYVCGIFPRSGEARLLFEHGAALEDSEGIFTGGGRQTRHFDIRPDDTVPEEAI